MNCVVEGCEDEAVGKCTVDNGASTERKPACEEHEGERFETAGATERYRDSIASQRQLDHYGYNPAASDPRM